MAARVAGLFSYLVPPELEGAAQVGQAVLAPLGARPAVGYILALGRTPPPARLKPLLEIIGPEPLFGPGLSRLIHFIARYYHYPPGQAAREILPGGLAPGLTRVLKPTETASSFLLGAEAELLARLRQAGAEGLDLKSLSAEGLDQAARRLTASGQARPGWRLDLKAAGTRTEWWLAPAGQPPAEPKRLGSREAALWHLAKDGPAKPLSYFSHYLPRPLTQARSLAAKGLIVLSAREVFRDDPDRALAPADPGPLPDLTPQQSRALAALETALAGASDREFLLFGVTGSGKTEVYLRAAAAALAAGREVLWLTPEIGLTLGLERLLKSRLGEERVAVLHSGLSAAQRHDQWRRIRRGLAPVVLGARSAVFAPLENLGLVVVDEEHDPAYKQDDGLRYNGRDLARWRAGQASAVLILGSATPSFESYQAALGGRLTLLEMSERPGAAVLPRVVIVDQRAEPARGRRPLSPALDRALTETLDRGEQALLFLNRRGLANLPMCLKCGQVLECPHCSRSLTLHGPRGPETDEAGHATLDRGQSLVCHACGYRADPPAGCPHCLAPLVRYFGVGTEKLLRIAAETRPQVRGARLDTDSTRRKGTLKSILDGFARGEFNLLVGTQMAAKGHDFPNLTLVGVVDADLGLNLPDFRAAERTFQLLTQVAGRAGRGAVPGTVIVQTLNPRHPALRAAAAHDYRAFFQSEIQARRELGYPPFSRLALIRFSGPEAPAVEAAAEAAAAAGRDLAAGPGLEILGPAPAPLVRLREQYRFQILIRGATAEARRRFLAAWLPLAEKATPAGLKLTADIDPYHFL
ncbi:MAG: primosomal protein N' [Candidatus Adiutrix sp.]|nr:primosomal protein N' [Candidatus Adiutrix sp.]